MTDVRALTEYVEVAALNGAPPRQVASLYVEVLTPSKLGFKGWGMPI